MKDFYVSVIVPTYNRANDLDRCLKSLQNQTFKDFEVVVCDDGSTDNTYEIVQRYSDLLTINYIHQNNFGGPARPRNSGIKEAKGNVIAFLDSDDWWYTNKLEVALANLKDYDLAYHNLDKYYSPDKIKGKVFGRELYGNITKDLLINSNGIPNSSVIIKKEIIDKIGFISEDKELIAVEDSDYWLRASFVTNKFKFINETLGAYWIGNNISVSEKQILREERLFEKYKYLLSENEISKALITRALSSAIIYHKLKMFKEAQGEYLKSIKNNKYSIKLKSLAGIILCFLRIKL
ncbi:glycosyltransferase family 2 protein [Flavobacterium sp. MDT1-60]|uniref:glycosyltransferase family 2 protein n=1 Tax=Flavobacterium sp. MDT1-60 TaxID=1979344 RepID=UPI00177C0946|nr:glycosyltransferase family 2 protein [Flavobacterium sp. MDT1-60]QOG03788.1 glycosyltransferase family 2 protein [Flavobacterium sp. MDT1-60]